MYDSKVSNAAIAVLSLVLVTSTPLADAQTPLVGPYYAVPSWDQTLAASARFVVLANFAAQAVLDRETGLVWERTPSTSRFQNTTFLESIDEMAEEHCLNLDLGGRSGWRLPTIAELASLADVGPTTPHLPAGHPFTISESNPAYWSSTKYYDVTNTKRYYDFLNGRAGIASPGVVAKVWCVRGGGGN